MKAFGGRARNRGASAEGFRFLPDYSAHPTLERRENID